MKYGPFADTNDVSRSPLSPFFLEKCRMDFVYQERNEPAAARGLPASGCNLLFSVCRFMFAAVRVHKVHKSGYVRERGEFIAIATASCVCVCGKYGQIETEEVIEYTLDGCVTRLSALSVPLLPPVETIPRSTYTFSRLFGRANTSPPPESPWQTLAPFK